MDIKKMIAIIIIVITSVSFFSFAEKIGLDVALEINSENIASPMSLCINPGIGYKIPFGEFEFGFDLEYEYPIMIANEISNELGLITLKLGGLYRLAINDEMKLAFGLENENDFILDDIGSTAGAIIAVVKYAYRDFAAAMDFEFSYLTEARFAEAKLELGYNISPVAMKLEIAAPYFECLDIQPGVSINLEVLTLEIDAEIDNIAHPENAVVVTPVINIIKSF